MATATKTAPQQQVNLPSVDLRRMIGQAISAEGFAKAGDLIVSATGGMALSVSTGAAFIKDDHAGGGGYYAATWTVAETVTVPASDPSNPRVDRLVLQVKDAFLNDGSNSITIAVIEGTPTANATLTNPYGAADVPGSALLLANILVDAGATEVPISNISQVAEEAGLFGASVQRDITTLVATNTGHQVDMLGGQFSIPGGALRAGGRARLWASGDILLNNTNELPGIEVRIGGAYALAKTGAGPQPSGASANRKAFEVEVEVFNVTTTSQEVAIIGFLHMNDNRVFNTGVGTYSQTDCANIVGRNTMSFDSTMDQTFELLFENSQDVSTQDVTLYAATLTVE